MDDYGDLAVNDNVVFEANTAGLYGGAVSLPFDCISHPAVLGYFER
jgi:predicted outer membrane repeat protein